MSEQQLEKILKSGDLKKCRDFFRGMPEKERRRLASKCMDCFREWRNSAPKIDVDAYDPATYDYRDHMPPEILTFAVCSTATLKELKKVGWEAFPTEDRMYEVLQDRRPDWAMQWAEQELAGENNATHWRLIRRLYLAGLIEKPAPARYIMGMICGIKGDWRTFGDAPPSLEAMLRSEPALREEEVWRLFEYEGNSDSSLASYDKEPTGGTWSEALIALSESGDLSRDRLLTCSLDALQRDFNQARAKWFADFHDALQPTEKETASFTERYLNLLGVSSSNIVAWAFSKVEQLIKAQAIDAEMLAANIFPVLQSRQKGIVKNALKLLDTIAKQSKIEKSKIAFAVSPALGHEAAEVQAAAISMIETYGDRHDAKLVGEIAQYVSVVAPSERKRLKAWLTDSGKSIEVASPVKAAADTLDMQQIKAIDAKLRKLYAIDDLLESRKQGSIVIPAARFDGTDIPRLPGRAVIEPIASLDELIEVCSRLIEDAQNIDDVERAFDGISRLCDQKPDDFDHRVAPLLQRAIHFLKRDKSPFLGIGPSEDLCGLIYAWCKGIVLEGKRKKSSGHWMYHYQVEGAEREEYCANLEKPIGFLSRRAFTIAKRVAQGKPVALWSAPTHAGAWIDPHRLVERVKTSGRNAPDTLDVILALLRLAPDDRKGALAKLKKSSSEVVQAVRYALGGKGIELGDTASLWIAAARSRAPWQDDVEVEMAFPGKGPDCGKAASYKLKFVSASKNVTHIDLKSIPAAPKKLDPDFVTTSFHIYPRIDKTYGFELGDLGVLTVESISWVASIWPQARESLCAAAASVLSENLDWWAAEWQNKTYLEPLLEPTTPLREMGLLLLGLALGAKDPGEHGLATDIAIAAIEEGRLGSDNLGKILHQLLPTGAIKPGRWAKTLADAARISSVHAAVIQQALQQAFSVVDEKSLPREYAKLLELLLQLSIELEQSITHPACREFLGSLKGSGKAAKIAKSLLQIAASPESAQRIIDLALQQRIHAVEARV